MKSYSKLLYASLSDGTQTTLLARHHLQCLAEKGGGAGFNLFPLTLIYSFCLPCGKVFSSIANMSILLVLLYLLHHPNCQPGPPPNLPPSLLIRNNHLGAVEASEGARHHEQLRSTSLPSRVKSLSPILVQWFLLS